MAIFFQRMVIFFVFTCTWFLPTKARVILDSSPENAISVEYPSEINYKNKVLSSDEYMSNLEFDRSYRSPRKIMKTRSTRVGGNLDLFTARGYGKRSQNCNWGMCKKEMALFSARRFGKRHPEVNSRLRCIITNCNNSIKTDNTNEDFLSLMERRAQEIPEESLQDKN